MGKHRMIQNNLLKNSVAAYYAAIEIHNKPNISYRYETTTLLLMNAWELLLKAFIRKYVKSTSIFLKNGRTIKFDKAVECVDEYINSFAPKTFTAIKENLLLIESYRNEIVHFYNEQLEPYIFMLVAKAALNYVEFTQKYFNRDVLDKDGLFILPLGFKLPFKPEDFLSKKAVQYISSPESKKFINSILQVTTNLNEQGVEDSVVLRFDIYLENVKKVSNSDLIAAITSQDEAEVAFVKEKHVRVTNDPSAEKVTLSDEDFLKSYPLRYGDIVKKCRERIPGFKQNSLFNEIMAEIKKDRSLSFTRKLIPNSNKSSAQSTFYLEKTVDEVVKRYIQTPKD